METLQCCMGNIEFEALFHHCTEPHKLPSAREKTVPPEQVFSILKNKIKEDNSVLKFPLPPGCWAN